MEMSRRASGSIYETAYRGDLHKILVEEDDSLLMRPDGSYRMLIHWAALGGHYDLVEYLLDAGSPVDPTDFVHNTPLMLASYRGYYEVVSLLISHGANVNHKNNMEQVALHYACAKGHEKVAKLLLDNNADINEQDILNGTPLHRAADLGRCSVVELLLSYPSIRLNSPDSAGHTPLYMAIKSDRQCVAVKLFNAGGEFDLQAKHNKIVRLTCSLSN